MLCSKLPYSHKHALYSCVKQAKPVLEATVGRRIGHVGRLRCQRFVQSLSFQYVAVTVMICDIYVSFGDDADAGQAPNCLLRRQRLLPVRHAYWLHAPV